MSIIRGVWGISAHEEPLVEALAQLRRAGYQHVETFSPIPSDRLLEGQIFRKSPVRFYTLGGAALGFVSGLALTIGTVIQWPLMTGGKPIVSVPPFLVIAFELTILLGGLFTLGGLVIHARLVRNDRWTALDARFSYDRFGVFIPCQETQIQDVKRVFLEAGVEETSIEGG